MNPYFKYYLESAAVGLTTGFLAGAACGSSAAIAAIPERCSLSYAVSDEIRMSNGVLAGAVVGASVGAFIGLTFYPAYKLFIDCGRPTVLQIVQENLQEMAGVTVGQRV